MKNMKNMHVKKTFILDLIMFPTLEKYHGTKSRHTCTRCGHKGVFVRYIDERGEYLSTDVGRCNRESKCGYHKKPREWFADNPNGSKFVKVRASNWTQNTNVNQSLQTETKPFDFIAPEHLTATLGNYDRNAFVQFLFDLFPDCPEEIQAVLKMYFVGTFEDYTCLPSIDQQNRVCRAKLIRFNRATGKRLKGDFDTSSLVRKLKLKEDFNYKQIFFGEHLLSFQNDKPVAVVESEKTAIIASLCMSQFVWLATGSKQWLKVERLNRLDNRQIVLYPDADGFDQWQAVAADAQRQGLNVKVSALIENFATSEQKQNQYDLADYLIEQQKEINELNEVYDAYNSKVELILNDESLFNGFKLFLEEQKAIAIYNGATEPEAERICTRSENVRSVVMSI
jgi:shikimate kinase